MFDQLKDLNNLRRQAAEMEKQLASESVTGLSAGSEIAITINGKHDVLNVKIAEDIALEREVLEKAFQQASADAQKKLNKVLADKFKDLI